LLLYAQHEIVLIIAFLRASYPKTVSHFWGCAQKTIINVGNLMTAITDPKKFLTSLFDAAVAAADPELVIRANLPTKPKGRTIVIGAGKGSAQMAAAFERAWAERHEGEDAPIEGIVVTRYGYGAPCKTIEIIEASHPVPDDAGLAASKRLFDAVSNLTEDDLVVALTSGAPISAMNAVRKHLSTIKGGRLAAHAHPAKVFSLVVSDIPGDNPAFVASGPTVPDETNRDEALKIIERYRLELPDAVLAHIKSEKCHAPKPDDKIFADNEVRVIASAAVSLEAAVKEAQRHGVEAVILSDSMEGEAREVAHVHAAIAREVADRDRPFKKPIVLLSGGETTVTIRAKGGKGGRNSEFLLAFALDIDGYGNIHALAADTDGIDGSEDNAGAFADGTTVSRLQKAGEDGAARLNANDAWSAFDAIGDLFVPGPTGTNVNDLRAILITG
jgi:hydroxypyruvate reductase